MAEAALKNPPVAEGPFLLGSAILFAKDPLGCISTLVPKYDGIFRLQSPLLNFTRGFKRLFIISDPDYVRHILQTNNRNYHKSYGYEIMKLLVGEGLLTSEGDFWRTHRRLMQPAFHRDRLAFFAKIMTNECQQLIKKWSAFSDKTVVNLSHDMMEMTLTIICKAMFSSDVNDAIEIIHREFAVANEKIIERVLKPVKFPLSVPTPGNIREKRAYSTIHKVVADIIEKRRNSNESYDDLMAMLMEAKDEETGEMMSDREIEDEAVTIFLAGHETTAVALTWLFHCLDENPEVETNLYQEARKIPDDRTLGVEDLPELEYTRMVIEETMRLYPPAWIIGRRAIDDDEIDGYRIFKDTNCLIPVYQIHRDERYWDEPLNFIPERFTKENIKKRHKFIYFPFGGGPRLCIGNNFALMEMQLTVPMIVQQFHLQKPRNFKFKPDPLITMRPEPEMLMEISKRDN